MSFFVWFASNGLLITFLELGQTFFLLSTLIILLYCLNCRQKEAIYPEQKHGKMNLLSLFQKRWVKWHSNGIQTHLDCGYKITTQIKSWNDGFCFMSDSQFPLLKKTCLIIATGKMIFQVHLESILGLYQTSFKSILRLLCFMSVSQFPLLKKCLIIATSKK